MADFDALVAGDSAITFAWQLSPPPTPGRTSKLHGPVDPEGRFGGCAPGVALVLAELGHRVALISWLGDDSYGRAYLRRLQSSGIDVGAVEVVGGQASPRALMLYDDSGSATCLHHPSGSGSLSLSPAGRERLMASHWLVLTAGPAAMSEALLEARLPATRIAWDVKGDPSHYPIPLRRRAVEEAHLLCFNRDELAFLTESFGRSEAGPTQEQLEFLRRFTHAVMVLTDGAAGCRVMWSEGSERIPAKRIEVEDPTGVGDAFFAAFLSATIRGDSAPESGRKATAYASEFLQRRGLYPATTLETKESS